MSLWLKFSHHIATARLPFRLFQRITNCYHLLKTILHSFSFKVSEFTNEMYYCTRIHKKIVSQWIIIKSVISVVASGFLIWQKLNLSFKVIYLQLSSKISICTGTCFIADRDSNKSRHGRPWLKQIPSRWCTFTVLAFLMVCPFYWS